ncbi:glutaminyl-peptide cyclotransferase [Cellulophaga sp. 20_2_10]|uniref:glutaminyl-peptide cyclotransferase n=1 Tax=Cellulophaga sp. 20_2_10 TaxID=2942476 RepID=UPI00201AC9A2|nr:glutaminyl-peptide cyclotransferase [Cellulophaga sp. 20_2_10]MCL5244198.1 glutaminyl-peptide cyclotransferase [Cellulophaga sp. 20_2_10]
MKFKLVILYTSAVVMGAICSQLTGKLVGALPEVVSESSGLLYYNGELITHNDSGNTPTLYFLDKNTFKVTRKVVVSNAKNTDWEDITQDQHFIYVADFGNYNGDRKDLCIYKISKKDINASDKVTAEKIYYTYPDQGSYARKSRSNFDAEALFSKGDDLFVLTKQWQGNGTSAYKIPKKEGSYTAVSVGNYKTNGMVTGANYNTKTDKVVLVGYNMFMLPFAVEVTGFTDANLFSGSVKKTPLDIGFAQIEGVTNLENNTYYISSESFLKLGVSASIFKLTEIK